ncbi:hypothetical protein CLV30_10317 [Haloactinopolyspora alba]|uniref:Uncharacterized protein n=1 Tax=Haloactinopolyspora alba TaxID=648780 RepID=A0A2P8E8Q7_9ACTN|nr:hypothetical protein [Haloactinopolyspora alba]PSL05866.1 hypothetical protein CLV30_10317 [Haloactinopolyspora alba]
MTAHRYATTSPRSSPPAPGRRPNRFAVAAVAVITGYALVRTSWQLNGAPGNLSPIGGDLVGITGWGAVVLCAAAAVLAAALAPGRSTGAAGRLLRPAAVLASLAMVTAGAMALLDVVGAALPGLGLEFYPVGALSRAACVGGGVLLLLAVRADLRAGHALCSACGRLWRFTAALDHTPAWARIAAYVSLAGCLTRVVAQLAVGMDKSPLESGASVLVFEAGFLLAGTVLPLAQAHRWGRVWPRWVPALGGRPVPRRLVLWPGVGVAAGITVYFGFVQVQMVLERLAGRNPFPPGDGVALPEAFFWVAVPAYLTWGVGLGVAALGYHRRTKRRCPVCAR